MTSPRAAYVCAAAVLLASTACEREQRRFHEALPGATARDIPIQSQIRAGPESPRVYLTTAYEENAWAVAEGKILYMNFNCVGCHAMGGGGSGPPLMDDEWIYGSQPENVFISILGGRPNGMPAFKDRLTNQQAWQITAYVRSMSGLTRQGARPGRDDHMLAAPPEASREPGSTPAPQVPPASQQP